MSDIIIKADHLTKDYGDGHGIFDVSFEVKKVKCSVISALTVRVKLQPSVI